MTQSNTLVVLPAFGNDIAAYVNEVVLPDAMKRLRARVVARKMVTVNNADESKEVGDTIRVPMPVSFDTHDEFDEVNGTTATPISVKKVDVKLDKHFYKQVEFSDMEFTGSMSGAIENALGGIIDVIGRGVNKSIANLALEIPNFSGNLTSANKRDSNDIIDLQEAIEQYNVYENRKLYLTPGTNGELLKQFGTYNYKEVEQTGVLSNVFDFEPITDNQAIRHKAGSASTNAGLKLASEASVGTKTLNITAVAGDRFVKGDVIVVAGLAQSFAVETTLIAVAGANAVQVTTTVKETIPAGSAVEVKGDHRIDLAATPTFAMLATRKLLSPADQPGVISGYITDEVSGLTLQSMIWYDASRRKHQFRLETLFGLKVLDHDRAMRMGGH